MVLTGEGDEAGIYAARIYRVMFMLCLDANMLGERPATGTAHMMRA